MSSISDVLQKCGLNELPYDKLTFRFARKAHKRLKVSTVYRYATSKAPQVSLAYLDNADVNSQRRYLYVRDYALSANKDAAQIYRDRCYNAQPTVPQEDAYIAAVLISLAQSHECKPTAKAQSVACLMSFSAGCKRLVLYKAEIPYAFLDELDFPYKYISTGFTITYEDLDASTSRNLRRELKDRLKKKEKTIEALNSLLA